MALTGAERQRRYYARNREKILAQNRLRPRTHTQLERARELSRRATAARRKRDPEHMRTIARNWARKNRARLSKYYKHWAQANPHKVKSYALARRALERSASGFCEADQLAARVAFYGGVCAYCKKRPYEHVDHVIPLSRGGSNWPANLRPACAPCNSSKRARTPAEWRIDTRV